MERPAEGLCLSSTTFFTLGAAGLILLIAVVAVSAALLLRSGKH